MLWGLVNKQESARRKKNKMEGHRKQRQKAGLTQSFTLRRFKTVFIIITVDSSNASPHTETDTFTQEVKTFFFFLQQTAD